MFHHNGCMSQHPYRHATCHRTPPQYNRAGRHIVHLEMYACVTWHAKYAKRFRNLQHMYMAAAAAAAVASLAGHRCKILGSWVLSCIFMFSCKHRHTSQCHSGMLVNWLAAGGSSTAGPGNAIIAATADTKAESAVGLAAATAAASASIHGLTMLLTLLLLPVRYLHHVCECLQGLYAAR